MLFSDLPGVAARRRRAHLALGATLAGIATGTILLLRFPSGLYHFYPLCPVRSATGLLCPGCGATRALTLLLQGHLTQALAQNALVLLLLPCIGMYFVLACVRTVAARPWPLLPDCTVLALLALTVLFTLHRNIA